MMPADSGEQYLI